MLYVRVVEPFINFLSAKILYIGTKEMVLKGEIISSIFKTACSLGKLAKKGTAARRARLTIEV
jgi:hypothetical protein